MVASRTARIRGMDQDKSDLKTLTRHFEVHNRSEGKSDRIVEWYNYHYRHGANATVLRYFTFYGPGSGRRLLLSCCRSHT